MIDASSFEVKGHQPRTIEITGYQKRVLELPEALDTFLGGGRGGGKTFTLNLLGLRHVLDYGGLARVLYVRRTYKALADFELMARDLFGKVFGRDARYNATEHVFRFPTGATFELGQLDGPGDYVKYQGRSFSLILVDEAGLWSDPTDIELLRSNLRAPKGMPTRMVLAANPGGVGHQWIAKRYVFGKPIWKPFLDEPSGREWVHAPSTYHDNPHLDQTQYAADLKASCPGDPELLRAWSDGDWNIARGAFFAACLDPERVALDPDVWTPTAFAEAAKFREDGTHDDDWAPLDPPFAPPRSAWEVFISVDFGVAKPSACYLLARSRGGVGPDGRWYPVGSVVALDEWTSALPGRPDEGSGASVPAQAAEIKAMCERWGVEPRGAADDAMFAAARGYNTASIGDEFRDAGVYLEPAKKGSRLAGWSAMRSMLEAAGSIDQPGLYLSRSCRYAWETLPYLARDPRRPEDLDTTGPDHAADAIRYGLLRQAPARFEESPIEGFY